MLYVYYVGTLIIYNRNNGCYQYDDQTHRVYTHGGGVLYIRTYIAHENGFINIYELLLRV